MDLSLFVKRIKKPLSANMCWEWGGKITPSGYGQVSFNDKSWRAHRLSYFFFNGDIPSVVMHNCDNRSCVNPAHLSAGTLKMNTQDMITKGRKANQKGEAHSQSKLTEQDVLDIRNSTESNKVLAARYGVHTNYPGEIKARKRWGWL